MYGITYFYYMPARTGYLLHFKVYNESSKHTLELARAIWELPLEHSLIQTVIQSHISIFIFPEGTSANARQVGVATSTPHLNA